MIDRKENINEKQICLAQDLSLSHAGTVWDGAIVLVYYWNKNRNVANQLLNGKKVLELGAGTGMVGVAASAFNPTKVFLTDLPQYLKILEINRSKNQNLSIHPNCLQVHKLEWGNPQDISAISQIDTLVGAQLAYDKQNVLRLMKTIKLYKNHNPALQVMIAYQRNKEEWRNLEAQFSECFGHQAFKVVSWGDLDQNYRDDHLGILYMM